MWCAEATFFDRSGSRCLRVTVCVPNCRATSLRLGIGFFVKAILRALLISKRRLFLDPITSGWCSSNSRSICGEEAKRVVTFTPAAWQRSSIWVSFGLSVSCTLQSLFAEWISRMNGLRTAFGTARRISVTFRTNCPNSSGSATFGRIARSCPTDRARQTVMGSTVLRIEAAVRPSQDPHRAQNPGSP